MRNTPKWAGLLPKSSRRSLLVKHASLAENVYHCCIHKTASQWIRRILSDYEIYRHSGLEVHNYEEELPGGTDIRPLNGRVFEKPFPRRTVVSPIYVDLPGFQSIPKPENFRAFFVMRDPRDYLVSLYFSVKVSHQETAFVSSARDNLQNLPEEEGLKWLIERAAARGTMAALHSWHQGAGSDPRLQLFRYRDLTGENQLANWQQLFAHCDIRLPENRLRLLLQKNAFSVLTKGRERGNEEVTAHLRKGVPGDWRNHFTPAVERRFREVTGSLIEELGYSW